MARVLRCGKFELSLDRPRIMGVVNVTPDSFSDGGMFTSSADAIAYGMKLVEEGADILDVGGESTRPGAAPVSLEEERRRTLSVIAGLAACGVPVAIDTRKPELMREAVDAGASMINDIGALGAGGAIEAVVRTDVAVCIMHMQGEPQTMQSSPTYGNVVGEVRDFLRARVEKAVRAGVSRDRIAVDPGFGFGKTLEHNLTLLRGLGEFADLGAAILVGLSRKTMLGRITGRDIGARLHASIAAALIAVKNGAQIVRVHDVAPTRDALAVWQTATRDA